MTEYRLYTFTNMYLSDIQRGIQSAHLVHQLFEDYVKVSGTHTEGTEVLWDWTLNHKTMIVLNGGYASELYSIYDRIAEVSGWLGLPFAMWHESDEALEGAATCVGVVVPNYIYEAEYTEEVNTVYDPDGEPLEGNELSLYWVIKGYPLA